MSSPGCAVAAAGHGGCAPAAAAGSAEAATNELSLCRSFLSGDGSSSRAARQHLAALPVARLESILSVVLSRNRLKELPPQLGLLRNLRKLDVSHNFLHLLPPELAKCQALSELVLHSNTLRPHARSLPAEVLACWPALVLLDLRHNDKISSREGIAETLAARLPRACTLLLSDPKPPRAAGSMRPRPAALAGLCANDRPQTPLMGHKP